MSSGNQQYEKPMSLGVNLESGFFSEDGSSGFGMTSFGGYLGLNFWKKGEKSSENKDNKITLNINQAMILNNYLKYFIMDRDAAYKSESPTLQYRKINNVSLMIEGFINNQVTVFGVIRFDTVEIDGINRIKMTVTKNNTTNSVVFCDKILKTAIPHDSGIKMNYDILDTSFIRFCMEVNNYVNFSWSQGAFNKILNVIRPRSNGNSHHNNSSRGGQSSNNRYSNSNDYSSNSDDDLPF